MISRYRILAQINLLHEYYRDGKCWDFRLVPSLETEKRLSDLRLRFKLVENQALVLIQVDEFGKPISAIPDDTRLTFYLELENPEFLTVSNVDVAALNSQRFHFTNLTGNTVGTAPTLVLNMSRTIDPYDNLKKYIPGNNVRIGTVIYECIKAGQGQLPGSPGSGFWIAKGTNQNVSQQDMVPFLNQVANFRLNVAASSFQVRIYALNSLTNVYDRLIRDEVVSGSAGDLTQDLQVDMTALPTGRYKLDINGQVFEAYFDNEAASRGAFGVIELFNHLPKTDAFSFVDISDIVREITYTLRFGTRLAYWKYVTPMHKVEEILLSSDHLQPSPFVAGSNNPALPLQKDFFVSKTPLALTEMATENLFDLIIGSESRPAPKPDPRMPGMLTQSFDIGSGTYLDSYCTMRLNH
jgi:hypothetical protein